MVNNKKLKYYFDNKGKNLSSSEEISKYELVEKLIDSDDCFFKLDAQTAVGILHFLGVPVNEIKSLYFELISPDSFLNTSEAGNYILFPNK